MQAKGLSISHLSKIYPSRNGKEKEVRAVDDISLDIKPGEFITLLGPSGCGKTTTLRMVAGFETPTGGEIYLDGQPINYLPPNKRDTAMVFQTYALFPNLNVYDNIAYGLKIKKLPEAEIKKKIQAILEMVGLTGLELRHTNELSGGQQQRVALARALVMEPSVLLFDEPLSNLDAKLRVQMRTEIRKIQKTVGITAIYVTHDQAEAMSMSDRIVIINNGKIEQVGSPEDIYYHPTSEFTANFIGTANIVPAKVEEIGDDGTLTVSLHGVVLKGVASGRKYKVGDECLLVIRPEACSVKDDGGFFDVTVTLSTFMGSYQLYEVDLGGKTFIIHENNPKNKNIKDIGDKARLVVDVSDIHAI
jgi:iron(III) transport system ATP-binding protein